MIIRDAKSWVSLHIFIVILQNCPLCVINKVTDIRRKERLEDLKGDDKLHYDSDIKVVNILLLGLLVDIYNLKEILEGTQITKQEHESMLYDEFDKFTSEPGESIHSYYLRFAKLINDMNMISLTMTPMQINTKFVNHLQPEWSNAWKYFKLQEHGLYNAVEIQGKRGIRMYDYKGEGHHGQAVNIKEKVKDSEWFKEKIYVLKHKT
ncbi:hypothetical protein Tco_1378034 [Tanacetum coccineum]